MIDVTFANFETEVIAASMTTPVLVDFWAPWCEPCKVIGPLLEKVEADYAGRFKLVKIDSDQEQQLAEAFGIRSIPTCILVVNGQPVDGFQGALPEGKVKEFLDKHVPAGEPLQAEPSEAEQALALAAEGNTDAALYKLHEALALDPANDDTRFDYVRLLTQAGHLEEAEAALQPTLKYIPSQLRFEALSQWIDALNFAANSLEDTNAIAELDVKIAANKRDFDARFAKGRILMAQGEWTAAMDELLEIIMRDKKWNDEAPRKVFIAILELLTPPKPKASADAGNKTAGGIEISGKSVTEQDPQALLVATYRRRLSMMLN
ncbi:thioredoxin [Rhodoferax sp.]|uniref:thioredoxin n=1 Tax=Rhodoferax sp. TaxID=50421 RepID=UPI0025D72DFB|nr:thioredoxin [Rhodoferax sp.]